MIMNLLHTYLRQVFIKQYYIEIIKFRINHFYKN